MKQTSYFGHEITQILSYVGIIFKRLPAELSSAELDELAEKSLDIGNEALTNQRPWFEITHVRFMSEDVSVRVNDIEHFHCNTFCYRETVLTR